MTKKLNNLNLSKVQKQDEFIVRGAFNQAIPVDRRGYYKFRSSAAGSIDFRVSRMVKDYPSFALPQQLSAFARAYVEFSKLWLKAHEYGQVRIVYCDGYVQLGSFGWQDDQQELRQRIMGDFISPSNAGKPMSEWQGVIQEQSEAQARGYAIDYGVKK
jgi:hypothetical protein